MNINISNILHNNQRVDIEIRGTRITSIKPTQDASKVEVNCCYCSNKESDIKHIDGTNKAIFPTFVNAHAHSAMVLFRGYGDDLPLEQWLSEKIWPNEANLNPEIVYWGSRLACLEMIKSGTTCFNDMYFFLEETAKAAEEMGIRAVLSHTDFDHFDAKEASRVKHDYEAYGKQVEALPHSDLIQYGVAPHSVYTVSGPTLQWVADFAREHKMLYHIHAAETQAECANALRDLGATPVRYLNQLGVLAENTLVAHGLWLDDDEIKMLGEHHSTVVHNPNSNLKLASGNYFKYNELVKACATIALGTDGCASSNNLDMIEAAKVMSLLQKGVRLDPLALPAAEALQVATLGGAKALRIDAGEVAEGKLADLMLVDLDNCAFVPNNNTVSNLIYAAHGDCVDTVICNGRILMEHRQVPHEQEIINQARQVAKQLITH